MENIASKLTQEQYEKNFKELHPPFSYGAALAEASRCLYCYDSPCMKACPTHIDISQFIKKISTDNLLGSAKTILKSNWVALTCAKACPVAVLCEGACVLNEKGDKPIEIGRLQRYVIDNYFAKEMPPLFTKKPSNGKSVAIIGSGPAGLSCSAELALLGYNVTVFESSDIPGGLNTWGIAPYKMRKEDALKEVELVKTFGVNVKTGVNVGIDILFNDLYKAFDAVFLGIGLGESRALSVNGEELSGVVSALDFIEQVKTEEWSSVAVGKRVAIIGAGNTSIDAATEAKRLGAEEVMVIYRRSSQDMSAYNFEFDLAKKDGIIFHFLTAPKKIVGKNFVEGIECIRMEPGEPDSKGKRRAFPVPGTEFVIPVDMVIKAIGQEAQNEFIASIPGVKFVNGMVEIKPDTYQTGNPKVFAGGDCINGGKEVVNAAYDGKMAAHGINNFLNN
ncbi:MAG: NAD(P)-dependent oxidoreductase [Ignavibacteriaceae bacterium]|nr:NAD(P)-dependent oxidoreductase [Ignavibacteriaceae bacterium]